MLTPGVFNGAYFEHALLARTMGVELVEGRDLECRRGRVMMRTTQGLEPVHVIYRRVDDEFLDPVHFRSDSLLGCPGLLNAARAGNVTIANAVGNGVADDKLIYTYLPDLIRYYLGEEPILHNVDTWRLGDADAPRGGDGPPRRAGGQAGRRLRRQGHRDRPAGDRAPSSTSCARRCSRDPRGVDRPAGGPAVTVPTFVDGMLRPRHVDLRPFAVNDGNRVWVLPGGLTRVALGEGELIVNSSRGGGSQGHLGAGRADPAELERPHEPDGRRPHGRRHGADHPLPGTPAHQRSRCRPVRCSATAQQASNSNSRAAGGAAMLSRIAESLFWIGRYVERAEDTARILDVQTQLILEDPGVDEETTCRTLLSIMGVEDDAGRRASTPPR